MLRFYAFSAVFFGLILIASGTGVLLKIRSTSPDGFSGGLPFLLHNYAFIFPLQIILAIILITSAVGILHRRNWGRLLVLGVAVLFLGLLLVFGIFTGFISDSSEAIYTNQSRVTGKIILVFFLILSSLAVLHTSSSSFRNRFEENLGELKQPLMGELFKLGITVTILFVFPITLFLSFLFTEHSVLCRAQGWERNKALEHANERLGVSFGEFPYFKDFVLERERFEPANGWYNFVYQTKDCTVSIIVDECGATDVGGVTRNCS